MEATGPPGSSGARLLGKYFFHIFFHYSLCTNVFLIVYFVLLLHFPLPEEGNHQAHALEVFNSTARKVMRDAILYACIQASIRKSYARK
jgi:hypothetical protein